MQAFTVGNVPLLDTMSSSVIKVQILVEIRLDESFFGITQNCKEQNQII